MKKRLRKHKELLKLPAALAPVKAAILPLTRRDGLRKQEK